MYLEQPEDSFTPIVEEIENLIINAVMTRKLTTQEIRETVEELLSNFEAQQ
jgi:hypothetical protein|tara:strand:+ start:353 stop:505 length:153 start_codon:yes stop_codon:yes gene_type:complete